MPCERRMERRGVHTETRKRESEKTKKVSVTSSKLLVVSYAYMVIALLPNPNSPTLKKFPQPQVFLFFLISSVWGLHHYRWKLTVRDEGKQVPKLKFPHPHSKGGPRHSKPITRWHVALLTNKTISILTFTLGNLYPWMWM